LFKKLRNKRWSADSVNEQISTLCVYGILRFLSYEICNISATIPERLRGVFTTRRYTNPRLDCSLLGAIGMHYAHLRLGLGLGLGLVLGLGVGLALGLALVFSET